MKRPRDLQPQMQWCVAHGAWDPEQNPTFVCPGCTVLYAREDELLRDMRLVVGGKPGTVLFRNQAGSYEQGWREVVSKVLKELRAVHVQKAIELLIKPDVRIMKSGLAPGAGDLIGIVYPYGRFLSIETKSRTGKQMEEQQQWVKLVQKLGGVAGFAYTIAEGEILWAQAKCESGRDGVYVP